MLNFRIAEDPDNRLLHMQSVYALERLQSVRGRLEFAAKHPNGASVYIDLRRLPELFCGFPRRSGQGPTYYPVACSPQAWAAAAMIGLVQACLGLRCDCDTATIYLDRPLLPRFLDTITIRNLRAGSGLMDLSVRRSGLEVAASVLRRDGGARLIVTS